MKRREFVSGSVFSGVSLGVAKLSKSESCGSIDGPADSDKIFLTGDGISLTPAEYAGQLAEETQRKQIAPDNYSRHGVIEELETAFARDLGKERAIYLPTGTMANHLAMRLLTHPNSDGQRAVVPAQSHLYNDSGDCAQTLSGINLIPLAKEKACFDLNELKATLEQFRTSTPVKALLIESPVRRQLGELVSLEDMKALTTFAKENNIQTHLDGARLYIASAYTGISPQEYASLFDTVFVSLNKYFNAGSGAILAGRKEHIDGLYHTRRMLGGSLSHAWPFATMALAYHEGFVERLKNAIELSEKWIANLVQSDRFAIRRIPNGSNIFGVTLKKTSPERFRESTRKTKHRNLRARSPNRRDSHASERNAQSNRCGYFDRNVSSSGIQVSWKRRRHSDDN